LTGYPPGPDSRGSRMDDEKATYPLYETLRKYGIRNICVHKGVPALFLAEYCHTDDVARAAADFPDLNLSPITSRSRGRPNSPSTASARNKEPTAFLIGQNPRRYARLVGTLLAGLGPNNILWVPTRRSSDRRNGRSRPSRRSRSPEDVREHYGYPPLDDDIKRKILDGNGARLFGLDIEQARKTTEADLLYKLRDDRNPPVHNRDWTKVRVPIAFD